jgi:uncharacterized membrane protein YjjP (DUF1212 family)
MKKQQWKILIGLNVLIAIISLLPFLPGPSFMSSISNPIFSLLQLGGIFGLILIPTGLIFTVRQHLKSKVGQTNINLFPILLWTIPFIVFTHTLWVSGLMRDFSRNFAIYISN